MEILKKNWKKKKKKSEKKKKSSENDIFRGFLFIFFRPLTLNPKKNPVNQFIKKFWPYKVC